MWIKCAHKHRHRDPHPDPIWSQSAILWHSSLWDWSFCLLGAFSLSESSCVVTCLFSGLRIPPSLGEGGGGLNPRASGLTAVNGLPLGHCYWDSFISISAPLSPQTMATNKTLTWKWVKCTWLVFSAGIVKQNKDGVKLLLDELWSPTAVVPQWILGSRCSRWHLNRKRTANESRPDDESKRGVSGTTENWKLRSFQVGGTVLWSERPHYSNSIQLVRFLLRKSFDTCCCYGCNKRLI